MDLSGFSEQLARVTARASGQVVTVVGTRRISGVIVADGQVLTVAHALPEDEVQVGQPDGRLRPAQVGGRDLLTDLALLLVPGLSGGAPARGTPAPVRVGTGRLGEFVLAVARPQPQRPQVSAGILADLGDAGTPALTWRTDARPFPGFSGGLLVNARGEWLGFLNAGRVRGELQVVPAGEALRVAGLLSDAGRVPRGYLGARCQVVRLGEDQPGPWGLEVLATEAGSPAEGALIQGDVLTALDGRPLLSVGALLTAVRTRPGEPVELSVLRGDQAHSLAVRLGER